MLLTINHQLFGPLHAGYRAVQPAVWQHPETANSSSIKYFGFRDGTPDLAWVQWQMIWEPNQNGTSKARLVAMDTSGAGYGTWEVIGELTGPANSGAIPQGMLVGDAFYRFMQARKDQYIGVQVMGDGVKASTLWEVRLMVEWSLPAPVRMTTAKRGAVPKATFLNHKPSMDMRDLEKIAGKAKVKRKARA